MLDANLNIRTLLDGDTCGEPCSGIPCLAPKKILTEIVHRLSREQLQVINDGIAN